MDRDFGCHSHSYHDPVLRYRGQESTEWTRGGAYHGASNRQSNREDERSGGKYGGKGEVIIAIVLAILTMLFVTAFCLSHERGQIVVERL